MEEIPLNSPAAAEKAEERSGRAKPDRPL